MDATREGADVDTTDTPIDPYDIIAKVEYQLVHGRVTDALETLREALAEAGEMTYGEAARAVLQTQTSSTEGDSIRLDDGEEIT